MEQAQLSLIGDRIRNEDRCLILEHPHCILMGIADGLGGYPDGGVAAQSLIDACRFYFKITPKPIISPRVFFHECVKQAHLNIQDYIQKKQLQPSPRTTLVLALVQDGQCYWTHAGDSRLYLIRQGEIIVRSLDHTVEQQFESLKNTLKGRMLTRCLSGDHLLLTRTPLPTDLQQGDILLLCSDGFWSQINNDHLLIDILIKYPLKTALELLTQLAYKNARRHSDNISVLAIKIDQNMAKMDQTSSDLLLELDDLNHLIDQLSHETQSKKS